MSNQSKGLFRLGTSGIVVPGNKQTIPIGFQDKSRLNYYASIFNTLEVNSTFKKLPMLSTFEKWSNDVPADFQFTIKIWNQVTHVKKLEIELDSIDTFLKAANYIGEKKGCLLIQFPGSITNEYHKQLEQILKRIHKLDLKQNWRKAVELRSTTWINDKTYKLLAKFNAAFVLQDMPKSNSLEVPAVADFAYCRYHGPKGDYRGSYDDSFLKAQSEKIFGLLNAGKDVYAYFNNTMGNAFENAMTLKAFVEK